MSKIVVIICGIELTIINTLRNSSSNILSAYWIVQTIGKHIVAQDTLAGGDESVGVDKSAEVGIIITALEVIELGFLVVHIAMVANFHVIKDLHQQQK